MSDRFIFCNISEHALEFSAVHIFITKTKGGSNACQKEQILQEKGRRKINIIIMEYWNSVVDARKKESERYTTDWKRDWQWKSTGGFLYLKLPDYNEHVVHKTSQQTVHMEDFRRHQTVPNRLYFGKTTFQGERKWLEVNVWSWYKFRS